MVETLTSTDNTYVELGDQPSPRRRRWPWIVGGLLLAALAWPLVGSPSEEVAAVQGDVRVADVVLTDLVEESTFTGTLGRQDADPMTTSLAGVVTDSAAPGSSVAQGEVLFEIDTEPVVLLYGAVPMYRDLAASAEDVTLSARRSGTVTSVPETGTVLVEGDTILRIDDEPVVLLYGDVPSYRTLQDLRTDMTGTDVEQLEQALDRLGFDPDDALTIDDTFTAGTENMVEEWQESIGATATGQVALGAVVFLPGPITVSDVAVGLGDVVSNGMPLLTYPSGESTEGEDVLQLEEALVSVGYGDGIVTDGVFDSATTEALLAFQAATGMDEDGVVDLGEILFRPGAVRVSERVASIGELVGNGAPVLAVSGNDIVVTVDIPASDQDLFVAGDVVEVELPDGVRASASVASVASVATVVQGGATTFEMIVRLDDPSLAGDLDEAPVDVVFVSDSVSNVMAVPVTSLLALREGGYAVEVLLADQSTGLVAVEPGFFADGLVEIASDQLVVGAQVVVP